MADARMGRGRGGIRGEGELNRYGGPSSQQIDPIGRVILGVVGVRGWPNWKSNSWCCVSSTVYAIGDGIGEMAVLLRYYDETTNIVVHLSRSTPIHARRT